MVPETCDSDSVQPAVLIGMLAFNEKNSKVPMWSRECLTSLFLSIISSLLKDKFCFLTFPQHMIWLAINLFFLARFLKINFHFVSLIVTTVMNVNFIAKVFFLSFISCGLSEKGFFRLFLGITFHTSFKEWKIRMKMDVNPEHWGNVYSSWITQKGICLPKVLSEVQSLVYH